ncbi:MAG: LON peptidase substrate-binding domain-containing protein, partial [Cetobacterium sp.]
MSTSHNSTDLVNIRDLLPEDIPVLPLVIRPIFPNILTPIAFTGEDFLQAIKDAEEHYNGFIGLVFVKDIDDNDYFNSNLYDVGTVVKINKVTSISQDSVQAIVFGVERFKKKKVVPGNSRLCWKVKY